MTCALLCGCGKDAAFVGWGPPADGDCAPRYRVRSTLGASHTIWFEKRSTARANTRFVWEGRASLRTLDGRQVSRTIWSTPIAFGPASPDTPCRAQPVDPVESMLAVGWPTLPGRRARVGDSWPGRKPEGICNALACESRECVADPWTHRLEDLEFGPDGERIASVSSEFAGHGTATARIDLTAGRLLSAEASLVPPARPGADEPPAAWSLRVKFLGCAG